MNTTMLENRLAEFTTVMKGIAYNLQYFKEIVERKLAEDEAHDHARRFIAHKGDKLEVIGEFKLPSGDVDPDKNASSNKVIVGETLEVTGVDALSRYETTVTLFRTDCGIDVTLGLEQIRKLLENDLIKVVYK